MKPRRRGSAIVRGDPDEYVLGIFLGVFDENVEVPVVVEDAGVQELVLKLGAAAAAVRVDQLAVGVGRLRVLVEVPHV